MDHFHAKLCNLHALHILSKMRVALTTLLDLCGLFLVSPSYSGFFLFFFLMQFKFQFKFSGYFCFLYVPNMLQVHSCVSIKHFTQVWPQQS